MSIEHVTAALRDALLAADAVIYNQGSSGAYVERLMAELGIADRLQGRTVRVLNGEAVMERLAGSRGTALAFLAMSDAIHATGLQYAGALPPALQNFTTYEAAVMTGAREPLAAAEFLRTLTTDASRRTFRDAGVD